jgi:hypothetical protein
MSKIQIEVYDENKIRGYLTKISRISTLAGSEALQQIDIDIICGCFGCLSMSTELKEWIQKQMIHHGKFICNSFGYWWLLFHYEYHPIWKVSDAYLLQEYTHHVYLVCFKKRKIK